MPERVPCEVRSSRDLGSTATSLPSAAASSASELDSIIEEHPIRLPHRLLHRLVPLVSEAELRGAARGKDCLPTADEGTRVYAPLVESRLKLPLQLPSQL